MKAAAATLTAALLVVALLLAVLHPAAVVVDAFQTAPVQIFPLLWLSKRLTSDKNDPPPSSSSSSAFSSRRRRPRSRLPPPPLRINAIRTPRLQQQRRRRQRYGGGRQQRRRRGTSSLTSISNTTRRIPFLLSPLVTLANIITTKLDPSTKTTSSSDKKLLHWITEESTYYNNIDTNNNMISSSIGIETHPSTNIRGLYAKRNYAPNEIIIEIPYDMALLVGDTLRPSYYNVDFSEYPNSEMWDTNDVDDVLQGLYFLEHYVLGRSFTNNGYRTNNDGGYDSMDDGEYYSPYVTSLPSKPTTLNNNNNYDNEEGLTPDFWSDSIINELGLPSYTQQVLNRKQIIKAIASNNNVSESDLQWATYLIRSRRFTTWNMVPDPSSSEEEAEYGSGPFGTFPTINKKKVEQIQGFLVPLIDMANHHPNPNAVMKISVNKWTRKFDTSSSFALRATKPILQGDEITISYGDGTSTCLELVDKYGFFVDNNKDENGVDNNGIDLEKLQPIWDSSVEDDQMELDALLSRKDEDGGGGGISSSKLKSIVSHFQNEYTINFPTTLDNEGRMKLIGSGIREKMGVNIYGVGLYGSSQSSLSDAVSPSDLRYKASQFDNGEDGMMTSFVLEMILQADGKIIAEAIADSVGIRYDGSLSDIDQLESLISDGIGGQSSKGMMLRFDCTKEGVALFVDGVERGAVRAGSGLAKAFVDVYLDNNAVSPSLIDSCIDTSSSVAASGMKNGIDGTASASRRSMLSLRIWLKRLKKWKKPDSSVVEGVSKNEVAVSDQDDTVTTGFVSGALGAVERSSAGADDSSEVESTDQEQQVVEEKNNVGVVEDSTEEATNDATSEEVVESNVIESTEPVEEAIQEIAPAPETTFAVSPKNIADIESKLGSGLTDRTTSVSFQPKLDEGLYLAGVGVRKKAIINVYAASMYTSPTALASVATLSKGKDAQSALRESARSFGPATPTTSFVLEMTFKADGKAIGEAIGEGVKPRYSGPEADVKQLESLIIDGVKSKGGQATKGTIFRFDCTAEGISVSVDGAMQGQVACEGIGSALVDVFMDDNAVSQQLVDSCLGTWCGSGLVIEQAEVQSISPPTEPVQEAIQEEIVPAPETTTFAVSPKNIADIESKLGSGLTDKATSVSFQPKLDEGLYLAGVGVRKKAIINVYAASMYTSPTALASVATMSKGKDAQSALRESARSFGPATPTTSFVLEMTFKADGKAIGEAIGEGVKPRYSGSEADVKQLESLIIDGVKSKGGQATKGTIFRFDCTAEGISVSVDGAMQGQVVGEGIGSALVDVFMDDNAVSQQLVDSCLGTWCGSGLVIEQEKVAVNQDLTPTSTEPAMTALPEVTATPPSPPTPVANVALDQSKFDSNQIAARIRELEAEIAAEIVRVKGGQSAPTPVASGVQSVPETTESTAPIVDEKAAAVASKVKSIKEKATGVSFVPELEDGLFLVGAGVRKKAIINVYAVSMYSSATAIASLGSLKKGKDAQATLRDSSRTFNALTPKTSFVLEMTFKADGKTIAEAIADGVKPRHGGSADDVVQLENLIIEGVKSKGGQATKGTIFRFDCSEEGISVSVDGNMQGKVMSQGIGSALVDVFMDNNAVSPQLVDSCMDTWCGSGL